MDKIWATGRRKSASARVRLFAGTGKITVNGLDFKEYFNTDSLCGYLLQPLKLINAVDKYDVEASILGGGKAGQAGAVRHGIQRALVKDNEDFKAALKKAGMLTRDSREKERKKPGQPGARKRFQFSKR